MTAPPPTIADPRIVQRDDGRFQIGLHDDAPSFETRAFAAAGRNRPAGITCRVRPASGNEFVEKPLKTLYFRAFLLYK